MPKKSRKKAKTKSTASQRVDLMYEDFLRLSGIGGKKDAPKKAKKKAKKKTVKKRDDDYEVSDLYDEPTEDEALTLGVDGEHNARDYFASLFDGLGIDPAETEDVYRQTLKKAINSILRKYKKIADSRFLYNTSGDLRKKYQKIVIHALIHSQELGYSVFSYTQSRGKKTKLDPKQWTTKLKRETKAYGDSAYNVLTQKILPSINNRGGAEWRFISLLAWNGDNGLSKDKNTNTSKGRNKTTKKRNANARNRNRRR